MDTFYTIASDALRGLYDRKVHTPPVLDKHRCFPGHAAIERDWQRIRAECLQVMQDIGAVPQFHEIMQEQAPLSRHGGRYWRMFILKAYGRDNRRNLAKCPTLAALLRHDRSIQSATFSFLEAGKHIPSHRGPFRGILRYHLGLVIPQDAHGASLAGLKIDGQTWMLHEGAGLLWDDTYLHEAWNHGDSMRAALLIDVIRPGMPWALTWLTKLIIALVGISIAVKGQEGW